MELLAKLNIENLYKAKDFKDKKPDEVAFTLKDKVGQTVTIPVATFVNNNRVGYYGIN